MLCLVVESRSITRYTTIDIHICDEQRERERERELLLSYILVFSSFQSLLANTPSKLCSLGECTRFHRGLGYKVGMDVLESHMFLIKQAQLVDIVTTEYSNNRYVFQMHILAITCPSFWKDDPPSKERQAKNPHFIPPTNPSHLSKPKAQKPKAQNSHI